jgi:hypothetical protein
VLDLIAKPDVFAKSDIITKPHIFAKPDLKPDVLGKSDFRGKSALELSGESRSTRWSHHAAALPARTYRLEFQRQLHH